ncbi:type II secretion system F family protein [Alkaliphilus hydrothermalis]|uniref:Tight adherence protein B n=1 Tax=Alkaliphilus hydrothermalis TaxID=1482730 RepID=A0ABS2NS91_9FIRM|nr:type II secretion system F family protein [Alkaliphilus hydrothermalis]MBM7615825.1 tight adherence protein B [Alkaliphilus hydrothermalis]
MIIRWILIIIGILALGGIILLQIADKKSTKGGKYFVDSMISKGRQLFSKSKGVKEVKKAVEQGKDDDHKVAKAYRETVPNSWLYDYNQYPMGQRERLIYLSLAVVVLYIIGYIFYQSWVGAFLLTPVALFYPSYKRRDKIELQKKQLNLEFKEALYVITSSLSVGKSLEMAIRDGVKELELLYPYNDTYIVEELQYIVRKIEMNVTVEEAFLDFAKRSHSEDIQNFVEVLMICKRTGGNLVEVMKNTSKMITDKIEFQQELDLMLSKRKFEQKILNIIPVVMVSVLTWSAPDYMAPVFNSMTGKIVMTVAILLFGISMVITRKIVRIEV